MNDDLGTVDRVSQAVVDALGRLLGEASPATVFSVPEEVGGAVVFTAAAWERVGGFGVGGGGGDDADGSRGQGAGGGGGGVSQGRPVAVIRVHEGRIDVTPVIDLTKIAVTVLMAGLGVLRALRR